MLMNTRIRQHIKDSGVTFTFIANRAGMDVKLLSRLMTGRQAMTVDLYEQICKGLEVDPAFFYQDKFFDSKNVVQV